MHIPQCETSTLDILSFEAALAEEASAGDYDRERWLYVPCRYTEYRYILGTRGENPLICIGINPSTAQPGDLDNTLKSVERIAHGNGYDSFIMFNVYAQRATDPKSMDKSPDPRLHRENMRAFEHVLSSCAAGRAPALWAAWGTIIEQRDYLADCLRDMIAIGQRHGAKWFTVGRRSKKGHPHHPLYLRRDSLTEPFDAEEYLSSVL